MTTAMVEAEAVTPPGRGAAGGDGDGEDSGGLEGTSAFVRHVSSGDGDVRSPPLTSCITVGSSLGSFGVTGEVGGFGSVPFILRGGVTNRHT